MFSNDRLFSVKFRRLFNIYKRYKRGYYIIVNRKRLLLKKTFVKIIKKKTLIKIKKNASLNLSFLLFKNLNLKIKKKF